VPAGAMHRYTIIERFTAVEATAPPAEVHGSRRTSRLIARKIDRRRYLWCSLGARAFKQGATSFNSAIVRAQRVDATLAQNTSDSHRDSGRFFMC
jgi:hypothetical protein